MISEKFLGTLSIPNMTKIGDKSWEELKNLTITQVEWDKEARLGFTLNDGQKIKIGTKDFDESHTFDPTKKITRIECIIIAELIILQINFYHHQ